MAPAILLGSSSRPPVSLAIVKEATLRAVPPMRRISILLALAAILLSGVVGFTYRARHRRTKRAGPPPQVGTNVAVAQSGWAYNKDDPQTNRPVVHISAQSFEATDNPSTTGLHNVSLRIYDKSGKSYTYVRSQSASFEESSGLMKSQGPVTIIMNVPSDKDAEKPEDVAKRVQVQTSGIAYETKSGKASTDQAASFKFSEGDGSAVGVSYDPNIGELHLKSAVSLDWIGQGPVQNKMHVEAGDLVYHEREHKIYLSPWSKLVRQQTTITAQNSVVQLDEDGDLQRIDSEHASGTDIRPQTETQQAKETQFAADHMTALFNDNGSMTEMQGIGNARVTSTQKTSRTNLTGDQATMRFRVDSKLVDGQPEDESNLSEVIADGHAVAASDPLPQPGVKLAESHLLRSDHIDLEMMPDGKNVKAIRTPGKAQLEFKPNEPDQSHRIIDASRIEVLYGSDSYIDGFQAWNAATKTEKPTSTVKPVNGKTPPPAYTWSDLLTAKFEPGSNQVSTIEQKNHFRYEEGLRKATADTAYLDQKANRITLVQNAHVSDDTGSAIADKIVMNQQTGDMDATGHVVSTHAPDPNQKPGTSMLDNTKTMQAKADNMQTRENNTLVVYSGNAVMWQGANRVAADEIRVDRDAQTLVASGNVVSELVDNKSDNTQNTAPLFTIVHAPELHYRDDTRVADYTGGVKLIRGQLSVTSKSLEAYLTPKQEPKQEKSGASSDTNDDSSLDHALANGNVVVEEELTNGDIRKGTAEHCEYTTKLSKVVLEGGHPEFHDSHKGYTKGRQLTYFSDDDKLIVDGAKGIPAYTQMKKH
jgi:lipopolysaccharide export system protein LptA